MPLNAEDEMEQEIQAFPCSPQMQSKTRAHVDSQSSKLSQWRLEAHRAKRFDLSIILKCSSRFIPQEQMSLK